MLVVLRFRVPTAARSGFAAALRHLERHLRGCSGLESLHVGTAVDDDELHTVVTTWDLPKSWRSAFTGAAGRAAFLPVMAWLLDEPTAYSDAADELFTLPAL
ncbi:MAG: hypothetical protein R5N71_01195 [Cutibacterium granulosum]|uniref:antibiotic biosynthesis monooxygenase family protein n=1 Tax=Cutibacterium granulosum TaxID=33011 RepID=UPI00290AADA3|nr:hypothetical protein [Cutibacterium granulosum]MDU3821361.1 hypothetical protein [Cutibacterium granulosum]MEA5648091.1 hypothetical protein [Cutibacterium granulosum]MEA5654511.1 hypothetical protein [Cutibacterium granulosum]MEA5662519.1 hypothetical protein [Cutibacterium granulosum]MEA5664434.1 hypothetical protein [Cutibacterium granulosum]